jgi:rhodanese-related sulfurtransferase
MIQMRNFLAIAAWLGVAAARQDGTGHTKDTLEDVKAAIARKAAVLVDVREQGEWDAGHLESALFLPLSGLREERGKEKLLETLPKKTILYAFCRSGKRALSAAEILKKAGYDVRPLKQGFDELLRSGFPRSS